ncbi:MAG: AAA family ATPase [Bryobacterales bacterium]|nr:AAA family ATPase [Bryobacterales bacterium]
MPSNAAALRFTHLLVRNWRNFLRVDLDLGDRVYLAGPSGSGKTNLLDVFRFLAELVSPAGGFQEAVRSRGGVRRLRCLSARQESNLWLVVHAGDEGNPSAWEYELQFNQEEHRLPAVRRERLSWQGEDLVDRPDRHDKEDAGRLAQTALEQGVRRKELREFAALLGSVRYFHPAAALLRDADRPPGTLFEPFGAGFLGRVMATAEKPRKARLRYVLEALGGAFPQLRELQAHRDAQGRPHLRALHQHWRPHGAWLGEQQLPDGALRLIALLWAALDGDGPLLLEEPELSVHPHAARMVPRMLARLGQRCSRQVIFTTHSPDVLCGEEVSTSEIALLCPSEEGTLVRAALDLKEAVDLLDSGALTAESGAAGEAPAPERQLGLFGGPR